MDFLNGEFLNELGVIGALFIVILVFLKLESRKSQAFIDAETKKWEVRDQHQAELYKSIIDQVSERSQRDYNLLKETLEDNRSQMGMLKETMREMKQLNTSSTQAFRDLFAEIRKYSERERCIHKLNNKQR